MILQQIRNPESQVRIDADGNLILKTVLGRFLVVFKIKDVYDAGSWIYNPVFPNACRTVFEELYAVDHVFRAGRNDLDDPVWGPVAPSVIQLMLVTDYGNVRFRIIPVILIQKDG